MAAKGTVGSLLIEMRADLGKLRVDVKEMESVFKTSFTNISAQAASFGKTLLASFGLGLGISQIVAFGKSVFDLGGKLSDLSAATGISVKALSGIKSTVEESGSSVETLAKGFFKLQAEIGNSTKATDPVRVGIERLGLSWKALTQASPEELLKKVTDALAKQENPLTRNAIAQQLLKKTAAELIPAVLELAGKFDQLKKQGLDDKDAKKLDEFGDAITRLGNSMRIISAGPLAEFIRNIERFYNITAEGRLVNNLQKVADEVDRLEASLRQRDQLRGQQKAPTLGGIDYKEQERQLKAAKAQLADVGAELGKMRAGGGKPAPPFVAPPDTKAADELKNMIEAIRKSNAALQAQVIEFNHGKEAAQNYTLAQQEMEENAKRIHPSIKREQDLRRELTDQLRLETAAREQLHKAAEQSRKDTPGVIEDIRFGLTPEETKEAGDSINDIKIKIKEFREEAEKLQLKMQVSLIKDDQQRKVAELTMQFLELANAAQILGKSLDIPQAEIDQTIDAIWAPFQRQIKETQVKTEGEKLGEEIAGSISQGLRNTLLGIETGQQTVGEGMKNLIRNMMLELQGAILDKTILKPLEAIASGFITGLVGALDKEANKGLKKWAENLGSQVSSWLSQAFGGVSSSFGGLFGGSTTMSTGANTLVSGMGYARGGMIPSFASGGLFIGHGGEFVMQKKAVDNIGAGTLGQMNQTGKVPSGGSVVVEINGDITPRQPNMTPDQVVRVTAGNITNDGMVMSAIEQRLRMRGR